MCKVFAKIYSCLIDSDRGDTYRFIKEKPLPEGVEAKKLWAEFQEKLEKNLEVREKTSKIDILRDEVSRECKNFSTRESGIYKLCVPTGGGKTLSSLRYALAHAKEKEKDRIFYIIPFLTILDQNAKEIKNILKHDEMILEHHSNIVVDNENEDYKLLTEQYNSPIVLTTMVQFLNTFFSGGTQNIRRMHSFAKSVIIFDEIQSLPTKCINMFNSVINFLSFICDSTIILCSATQPLLDKAPVPLQLAENSEIVPGIEQKFLEFKRVSIKDERILGGYSPETLKDFSIDKMKYFNSALIIMNTKKFAKQVYTELEKANSTMPEQDKFEIFHLSTNMCPAHRTKVLECLLNTLGKKRVICVSTQLIEAGINISFECVIRALAGLDNIAQAAGRCNRHGEQAIGNLYIVNLKDESLSLLPDIKIAADCCERVLDDFSKESERFDGNLLSQKAMDRYYEYYFFKREHEMNYNINKLNTTMYDLLSINEKAVKSYCERFGGKPGILLKQAYKTAGENFEVIDTKTIGVIVPYSIEGKKIISVLNGVCSAEKLKSYLKKAQQCSVDIFYYNLEFIEKLIKDGSLYKLKNAGILALNEDYYNEEFGVDLAKHEMKFLNF